MQLDHTVRYPGYRFARFIDSTGRVYLTYARLDGSGMATSVLGMRDCAPGKDQWRKVTAKRVVAIAAVAQPILMAYVAANPDC